MGSKRGVEKVAARRIGVSIEFYDMMISAGQKWCTSCKRWHPRRAFGSDASRSDGLSAKCDSARIASIEHPGKAERRKAFRNGLAWCSGCRSWLPVGSVRRGQCREHIQEAARDWYSRNSTAVLLRKSARRRGLEVIPAWWRDQSFELFGGLCAYGCGRAAEALDHISPVVRGGLSEPSNLAPACVHCNSSKKDRDPALWVARGLAAFPDQWFELAALAAHSGQSSEWAEVA